MENQLPDLPLTLTEAEAKFSSFLVENSFPTHIRWVLADQIALTSERSFLVRADGESDGRAEAERRYSAGLTRSLGVSLNAICATAAMTIAYVYIPKDRSDAQTHLIGPGLKLSCPAVKISASMVTNSSEWESLDSDIIFYSKLIREGMEL